MPRFIILTNGPGSAYARCIWNGIWNGHLCVPDCTELTFPDNIKRFLPFLLLAAYGVFLCSYFIFRDYGDPYRVFARGVFVLGIFVVVTGIRDIWRQPLFLAIAVYIFYLLLSGFWSNPLDWYRFGQKLTISLYLLGFFGITRYLLRWNSDWFRRMLQLSVGVAAVAALISLAVFYRDNSIPGTRMLGIGALTNINEFANVYGIFAMLAMGFALQTHSYPRRVLYLFAIALFICVAWFGQSRTAFVSMIIALSAMASLTLNERQLLYVSMLVALAGALSLIFPDMVEQAFLRGQGLRPQIWAEVWREAVASPILGHGLVSQISLEAGGVHFETAHNAYLQVFWEGGIIGLCLFLLLLAVAFHDAWTWGLQQRDYTVFCILIFAACTMMTGVDTFIARPRDQWMLFWLPLALLLSYHSQLPRSRPG